MSDDDGCCHKTRLIDSPCPLGWECPHIMANDESPPEIEDGDYHQYIWGWNRSESNDE